MKRYRHLKHVESLLSLGNGRMFRRAAAEIHLVVGIWLEGVGCWGRMSSCGNQAKDPGLKGSTP